MGKPSTKSHWLVATVPPGRTTRDISAAACSGSESSCRIRSARAARAGDVRHSLASLERAEALLGYRPAVDLRTGLQRTLEWYRSAIER